MPPFQNRFCSAGSKPNNLILVNRARFESSDTGSIVRCKLITDTVPKLCRDLLATLTAGAEADYSNAFLSSQVLLTFEAIMLLNRARRTAPQVLATNSSYARSDSFGHSHSGLSHHVTGGTRSYTGYNPAPDRYHAFPMGAETLPPALQVNLYTLTTTSSSSLHQTYSLNWLGYPNDGIPRSKTLI